MSTRESWFSPHVADRQRRRAAGRQATRHPGGATNERHLHTGIEGDAESGRTAGYFCED
jgi:hypothetical protein